MIVAHAQRGSGQAGSLARMIASEQPFAEVGQRLPAVRGSLDSLLIRLVELELADRLPSPAVRDDVDNVLRTVLGHSTTMSGRRREQKRASRFDHPELAERTDA